jgi:membrane-associated phospholipid phosphatase
MTADSRSTPVLGPALAILLSATALVVVFWGLLQLDVPVARFMRSVHLPWLEFLGDLAHRLGGGPSLLILSTSLLAAGWLRRQPVWRQAGLEGLIAHGIVAVAVQSLKHLVGRPRPRLMHGNGLAFGPSWDEGLDSFPSGHTSASFAVAVVLAHHFPRARWWFYALATAVGLSRVLRGSHFPTDVIAGVTLGVLVGTVVVSPFREWRSALRRGLVQVALFLVLVFGLLWTALRVQADHWSSLAMVSTGVAVILTGIAMRLYRRPRELSDPRPPASSVRYELVLIAVGLGLTTGSPLVAILALFVATAHSLVAAGNPVHRSASGDRYRVQTEIGIAIALAIGVLLIQALKGILPLL